MGRPFLIKLEGNIYSCKHCQTHFALSEDIFSKSFHCRYGKAYLFNKVVNVNVGEKEERMMMTGMHTVVDIFCVGCGSIVGWKYEAACDKSQKYKEGKYIIERFKVLGPDGSLYILSPEAQGWEEFVQPGDYQLAAMEDSFNVPTRRLLAFQDGS